MKICNYCGNNLVRRDTEAEREFINRLYCNRECFMRKQKQRINAQVRAVQNKRPIDIVQRYVDEEKRRLKAMYFSSRIVDNNTGCWIWAGYKGENGYGYMQINTIIPKNVSKLVHRVSALAFGKISSYQDKRVVMHTCDFRLCFNPDHLVASNHKENTNDAIKKGRMLVGSKNGLSKLNEEDIKEIKSMLKNKFSQKDIALMFEVDQSSISDIKNGKNWGWLQ